MSRSLQGLQRNDSAPLAIRTPQGRAFAVGLATAAGAWLSFALAPVPGSLPPVWLPTACAVAAAYFWGPLAFPAVVAGVMLGLAGRGQGPLVALLAGVTDGVIGLLGARLLRSLRFRPAIDRLRDVWSLAASVALLAALATALDYLLHQSISVATSLPPSGDWYGAFAARLLGFAALAPVLFSWGAPVTAPAPLASHRGEMAGLALATAAIAWLAFAVLPLPSRHGLPGILVLCLAWAATRGHQRAASLVTLCVTLAALALIRGQAIEVVQPFDVTVEGPLSRFAISMAMFSVVGLVLAAAMLEREISVRREDRTSKVLDALYHDTPLGMTAMDAERRLTVWNPAAERLYGWRPEEVLGLPLPEAGEAISGSARHVEEELSAGRPVVGLETRRQRRDGSWLDVRLTMTPVFDEAGRLAQVITLHEDISDRRRREESLREEEAKYRLVFEAASDAIFLHDPETLRLLDVNAATVALYGYSRDELLAMTSIDLSAEPEETRATIRQAAERGSVHVPLRLHRHREGHLLPVEITGGRLPWQGRTIAITIARDIRTRVTEEQERRDREAYLRAVLEHASDIVTILDAKATIRWGSPSITRLLGYQLEEVVGQPMAAFIHPDDLPAVVGAMERIVGEPGRVGTVLSRFRHKDGSWRQLESVGRYLPDTPGIQGVLVNARDATDRLEMEARNERSRQRFEIVANATNDVVWEWDIPGKKSWWSEGITRVFGWRPEELERDQDWADRIHPDDLVRANGTLQEAVERGGMRWKAEYRFRRADGRYAVVLDQAWSIVRDADGRALRMIGAMTDLTERREAERLLAESREQLRQATKMEAMGRLAGGIAHDFNNILTSLLGHTDLALAQGGEDEALQEDLQEIRAAGLRAAGLTQQLLAFSRKQVLEPRVVNLNEVVSAVHRMLARVIGEDIELVIRLAPDLARTMADPGQVEQVLVNLAINARDAMPDGGRLVIETSNESPGPAADGAGRRFVLLSVGDTGHGMEEETQARIFEPFFTTKGVGKGTGLGLAMVYGVVQQSGGEIRVESAPGQGTTFRIFLPEAEAQAAEEAAAPAAAATPVGGTETILVVEDEAPVRELVRRQLARLGYRVLVADNGEEALRVAEAHPGPVELLLTDVVMPGMGGTKVVARLASSRPAMRVIYMSGYAGTGAVQEEVMQRGHLFIAKPFTPDQLARRVREALEA